MKDKLIALLEYLTVEQKSKEVIEVEYTHELEQIVGKEKVSIIIIGKTKKLHFAGLGSPESFDGKIDLAYRNKSGNLVVKPKLISEFINLEE